MNSFLQHINYKETQISVLRLDILHPDIQGNKYYKLKYNLEEALNQNKKILLSFGGEFSNHIHALSLAGKVQNLKTIGIIRGDKPDILNATLKEAEENGMILYYTSRTNFRILRRLVQENDFVNLYSLLKSIVPDFNEEKYYIIPEGGTNKLALKGTQEILNDSFKDYDYACVSIGTGGTISGIIASADTLNIEVIGFPSLIGDFYTKDIEMLLKQISGKEFSNWQLKDSYHFGGFAAFNEELIGFLNGFYSSYNIPLDTIYTGKMFFGIFDLIDKGFFKPTDKILAIHTGGLQGLKGFNEKHGNLINY